MIDSHEKKPHLPIEVLQRVDLLAHRALAVIDAAIPEEVVEVAPPVQAVPAMPHLADVDPIIASAPQAEVPVDELQALRDRINTEAHSSQEGLQYDSPAA